MLPKKIISLLEISSRTLWRASNNDLKSGFDKSTNLDKHSEWFSKSLDFCEVDNYGGFWFCLCFLCWFGFFFPFWFGLGFFGVGLALFLIFFLFFVSY